MSLMDKKISELTPEERKKLEKPIGTLNMPWPTRKLIRTYAEDGHEEVRYELVNIQSDVRHLRIPSRLSLEEFWGRAYREMPTPHMIAVFVDLVRQMSMDSDNRTALILGNAGDGKSFMCRALGALMGVEPIVVDFGGRNGNEMVFVTVLDTKNNEGLTAKLEERLREGKLHPASVAELKEALGKAYHVVDDGTPIIDWNLASTGEIEDKPDVEVLRKKVADKLALAAKKDGRDPSAIDPDEIDAGVLEEKEKWYSRRDAHRERIQAVVNNILFREGLTSSANAIGITVEPGPGILAWMQGVPLVAEEWTKSKKGGDDALQTFLEFVARVRSNGPNTKVTIESPVKEKGGVSRFEFRAEDLKPGFFMFLTGNEPKDGSTTRELNASMYSRINAYRLGIAQPEDWAHRAAQILLGLPLTTLYRMSKNKIESNPEAFKQALWHFRTKGLSDEQVGNIPEHQRIYLNGSSVVEKSGRGEIVEPNWRLSLQFLEVLGNAFFMTSQLVDPDAKIYKGDTQNPKYDELLEEISAYHRNVMAFDFRRMIKFIEEALIEQPDVVSINDSPGFDFDNLFEEGDTDLRERLGREPQSLRFGTNLVKIFQEFMWRNLKELAMDKTYGKIMEVARNEGFVEEILQEGRRSDRRTAAELMDISAFDDPDVAATMARKVITTYLQDSRGLSAAEAERAVSQSMLQAVMQGIRSSFNGAAANDNAPGVLPLPSEDLRSAGDPVIVSGRVVDASNIETRDQVPSADDIADDDAVLASVVMSQTRAAALRAFWADSLDHPLAGDGTIEPDQALELARGLSASGLSTTTLMVAHHEGEKQTNIPLHLIRRQVDGQRDQLLAVGGDITPSLERLLRDSGFTYVNRNDSSASQRVKIALSHILRGVGKDTRDALKMAFLYRNAPGDAVDVSKASLQDLLTMKEENLKTFLPRFVLRRAV